jgi:hypothetical protein
VDANRPIDDFMSHVDAMRSLVAFLVTLSATVPYVMTLLTEEQRRAIYEPCVLPWMKFNEVLYNNPELYKDPPRPMPVDQNCPPLELSDHIQERLGKNHPFFDFIHAPITQPLGTQVSLVSINYCWDAYDTFVKRTISSIIEESPNHPNCIAYREHQAKAKAQQRWLSTDEQLQLLGLPVEDSDLDEFLKVAEPNWSAAKARQTLKIGKVLRSIFTHHFGKPDDRLVALMKAQNHEAIRVVGDKLEVLLPLVNEVATVVQGHALIIHRKRSVIYGGDPNTAEAA